MVTAERERQIRENLGLVHTVANRFRGRGIEYDDLYQSGCVGLIKAVDRFDPTLGYAFSTYAVPVIIGEIKRLFRDGGAVKVSRVLKEKARRATAGGLSAPEGAGADHWRIGGSAVLRPGRGGGNRGCYAAYGVHQQCR